MYMIYTIHNDLPLYIIICSIFQIRWSLFLPVGAHAKVAVSSWRAKKALEALGSTAVNGMN